MSLDFLPDFLGGEGRSSSSQSSTTSSSGNRAGWWRALLAALPGAALDDDRRIDELRTTCIAAAYSFCADVEGFRFGRASLLILHPSFESSSPDRFAATSGSSKYLPLSSSSSGIRAEVLDCLCSTSRIEGIV